MLWQVLQGLRGKVIYRLCRDRGLMEFDMVL